MEILTSHSGFFNITDTKIMSLAAWQQGRGGERTLPVDEDMKWRNVKLKTEHS